MSQPIAVSCPHCRAQFAVQDPRLIGQQVRCPGCSQPFVVSPPTQTPQAPQTLGGVAGAAASQVPVQQSPAPGAYVQPPQTPPGVQPQQPDPLAMPGGDPLAMPGSDPLAAPHDPLAAPHDPLAAPHDPLAAPVGQTQRPLAGRGGYGYQGKKKSNWQKPALIGGGVVLGLAMLIMLISLLTGGSARRGGDGNIVDMTYLPANSEMVAFVDVQRLVRSSMVRDQIANDPKAAQAIKEMEEETGLTPQDVASITFGGALEGNSAVAVVRLLKDFDTSKLGNMPVEATDD